MKKSIRTSILGALALLIPACNVPQPTVTPVTPSVVGSTSTTPTPTPKPSIWANLGSNVASFNSGVATVWSSAQVQAVVQAAAPVALQAIDQYVANGGKLSSQQGAALVLQGATVLAPTITSNTQLQHLIVTAAIQGAGNNSVKQLATTIGHAVAENLPNELTSVQAAQAISAAGTLIIAQNAAAHPLTTPAVEAIPTPSPTPTPTVIIQAERIGLPFKHTAERHWNPYNRAI